MLKWFIDELWSVVQYYGIGNYKSAYNVPLDELGQVVCLNLSVRLSLQPLGEIINRNEHEFSLPSGWR